MSQSEGDALFRAILENPYDDAPRLIYSDWLEEHGNEPRAREIRLSVSMSRLRATPTPDPSLIEYVRSFFPDDEHYQSALAMPPDERGRITRTDRGFISEVALPINEFLKSVKVLFERFPIVYVSVRDRYPVLSSQDTTYKWLSDRSYQPSYGTISRVIFDQFAPDLLSVAEGVASFSEAVEAEDAFSQACVSLGRDLAGLPPLKMV